MVLFNYVAERAHVHVHVPLSLYVSRMSCHVSRTACQVYYRLGVPSSSSSLSTSSRNSRCWLSRALNAHRILHCINTINPCTHCDSLPHCESETALQRSQFRWWCLNAYITRTIIRHAFAIDIRCNMRELSPGLIDSMWKSEWNSCAIQLTNDWVVAPESNRVLSTNVFVPADRRT